MFRKFIDGLRIALIVAIVLLSSALAVLQLLKIQVSDNQKYSSYQLSNF